MRTAPVRSRGYGVATASLIALAGTAAATAAHAEEGMWTLDNLPKTMLQQKFGFTPTQAWIDHVMHASARLALGCSASFVSPDGLVMTNHHCANGCLTDLSTKTTDDMQNGYTAASQKVEPRCPGMELNQLDAISDVTSRMNDATKGKSGADFIKAQHGAEAAIEKQCGAGDPVHTRCDVVTLYHGGRYALYRYKRFDDVRLVFAPGQDIAFFGGDPDNFNYPRYDIDVTFLRAYENGKPAHTQYFKFDPAGPKAGEFVITSGNPGNTERDTTASQLVALHDVELPLSYGVRESLDGVLWEMARQGPQQAKETSELTFGVENTLKVYTGWLKTLAQPALLAKKRADEKALLDWIDADPQRKSTYGDPFAAIDATLATQNALYPRFTMLEGTRSPLGFMSRTYLDARILVRAAAERAKPDADRLAAYRDANLPALEEALFSHQPIYPDLEDTTLAFSLTKLRQVLGADDPTVQLVLGHTSPELLAKQLTSGTKLADVALRRKLWDGGQKAIDASTDPMIAFAKLTDGPARAVEKSWEDEVEAPQRQASEVIARARFARDGTSAYPDATFTERLSFGKVEGWNDNGTEVPPFTDFAGLYKRATGYDPFKLSQAWLGAKSRLDLATPLDFVSTNDIIGGNSGSPVIDQNANAVGLIFDGNIDSIAGDFVYDPSNNRAVSVDTAALLAALRVVYKDQWLVDELVGKSGAPATATD